MKLSIITINYNNASGLKETMQSVINQTSKEFEYIVVDGASTDESMDLIYHIISSVKLSFNFISEPDSGIYNAMNKGIRMAKGDYVQFLNSGDLLASQEVTEKMLKELYTLNSYQTILYGNMLKLMPKGIVRDRGFAGRIPTMLDFYNGTLNHSPAYIKRDLFETYGLYDESLKVVSDWKWYLQVIALCGVVPVYKDIDVTIFDMNGISNVNSELEKTERREVLENLIAPSVLLDYDRFAFSIDQLKRIKRFWFFGKSFWLIERILFKYEKWFSLKE